MRKIFMVGASAAAVLVVIAVAVKIMINVAESDGSFLSYETVEKTKFFKYIFNRIQ